MSSLEMRQAVATVENLPEQMIEGIEASESKTVTEVEPLYNSVDLEALSALFRGKETSGKVVFHHADCEITVFSDGRIDISPSSP